MSQFFFNQRASLVNDVIEGTIIASPWNNLARLESDPAIRVVVRRDLNKNNVAVISGGGSGHEPAHVGFIGKGMLTAAVCGDLFASPSVDAVLTAIQAVTGEAGCLLIVKNYTGDRLNFGLAAEKAKRYGLKVEMAIVADDIALPDNKQPRGIAGTALVHEAGETMAEIVSAVTQVTDIMGEIASASDEQSRGIDQVGQAVAEMDRVTQQNASLVEESASAAAALEEQAARLNQTVAVFKV